MNFEKAKQELEMIVGDGSSEYVMTPIKVEVLQIAIEALENCPPENSICYGCHDNCRKCETQNILMI